MKKSSPLSLLRLCRAALICLTAGCLSINSAKAAPVAEDYALRMVVAKNGRSADVAVPDTIGRINLERFDRVLGWQRFTSVQAVPGRMHFNLPPGKKTSWRAVMHATRKLPSKFFKGKNTFPPIKSDAVASGGISIFSSLASVGPVAVKDNASPATPVEADIWKIDGTTVFYFNQLRGLQVLDLANPADPRLTATLRLPAVGQDLYLLPGSSGARNLILLTSINDGEVTRINLVKVSGTTAEITFSKNVRGRLADSRLVGNRLVLATTRQFLDDKNSWSTESRLSEWLINPGQAPMPAGDTVIPGSEPLIAAGADWLAVATTGDDWYVSQVTVFALREAGLRRLTRQPIRIAGQIADRFKIQWNNNVLTTISERNYQESSWSPTTVLENFRVWGPDVIRPAVFLENENPRLGKLQLADGESLFAARFSGKRAYVVTFLQTDPLWVVDLSDPADPVVAGHLEVPGWSTHLEPIGDLLFSIGWESGSVAASLFDVANPAHPALLKRLNLGDSSEALWDDKALKVLPDEGLAMIPMNHWDSQTGASTSGIQLLDLDIAGRDLRSRGFIPHAFDARRAGLSGDTVVSISQRGLVTADIKDRDEPSILAEVTLAWPVDRVLDAGSFLVHIETGNPYSAFSATARVTPAQATEQVLSETDLGTGTVRCVEIRNGQLLVLRENTSTNNGWAAMRWWGPETESSASLSTITLDIYDASALPALAKLGSCAVTSEGRQGINGGKFLWPQPNRPCVVLDAAPVWPRYFWRPGTFVPMVMAKGAAATTATTFMGVVSHGFINPYRWQNYGKAQAPQLVAFEISNPAAPTASTPLDLGPEGTTATGASAAADGLLVVGTAERTDAENFYYSGTTSFFARVISVAGGLSPVMRPPVDLPGSLFEVTRLDADGFLAFTSTTAGADSAVQVSACDGYDAYLINQMPVTPYAAVAASGRRVFTASQNGIESKRLDDSGAFVPEKTLEIGWRPDSLRCVDNVIIAANWNRLYAADVTGAARGQWQFAGWSLQPDKITVASDGDLLVPFGEYGAERLHR